MVDVYADSLWSLAGLKGKTGGDLVNDRSPGWFLGRQFDRVAENPGQGRGFSVEVDVFLRAHGCPYTTCRTS